MTTLLRTAADFDDVPEDALVVTIEIVLPEVPHGRNRRIWRKYGRQFVELDPSDRSDGEETKQSGYLENLLTGFGSKRTVPGVGLLLDGGDSIATESAADLPQGSIIQLPSEDHPHMYSGGDRWQYMDPGDVYDGDYPATTANIISGETTIQVLYRPGDEDLAGFTIEPSPHELAASAVPNTGEREPGDIVEPCEYDIDKMSPCAQAYVVEYGSLPKDRAEQDRYNAFRFGYERGERRGEARAYAEIAAYAKGRSDD